MIAGVYGDSKDARSSVVGVYEATDLLRKAAQHPSADRRDGDTRPRGGHQGRDGDTRPRGGHQGRWRRRSGLPVDHRVEWEAGRSEIGATDIYPELARPPTRFAFFVYRSVNLWSLFRAGSGGSAMDADVLKVVGQVAGIGGLALGVFLLLFRDIIRKNIFPKLPHRRSLSATSVDHWCGLVGRDRRDRCLGLHYPGRSALARWDRDPTHRRHHLSGAER